MSSVRSVDSMTVYLCFIVFLCFRFRTVQRKKRAGADRHEAWWHTFSEVNGMPSPWLFLTHHPPLEWIDLSAMKRTLIFRGMLILIFATPKTSLEVQIWYKNKHPGPESSQDTSPTCGHKEMIFRETSRSPALTPWLWWWWTYPASTCLWRSAEDDATQLSLD